MFGLAKQSTVDMLREENKLLSMTVNDMQDGYYTMSQRIKRLENWVTLLAQVTNGMCSGSQKALKDGDDSKIKAVIDETLGGIK